MYCMYCMYANNDHFSHKYPEAYRLWHIVDT